MQIGFFFWPFNVELTRKLAALAETHDYGRIGIADTPGNAMDPWVSATLVAQETRRPRVVICVTNLASRHPAVSAAAIASPARERRTSSWFASWVCSIICRAGSPCAARRTNAWISSSQPTLLAQNAGCLP